LTDVDLLCLKSSIDKVVEIETVDGERLLAKVVWVFDTEDNPDVFYELVSTSHPDHYPRLTEKCGYSLPLENIVSVKTAKSG
jgi:hypothetical protein